MSSGESHSRAERVLGVLLRVGAALLFAGVLLMLVGAIFGWAQLLTRDGVPTAAAVGGATAIGMTMVYAAGDPRGRRQLTWIACGGLALSAVVALVMVFFWDGPYGVSAEADPRLLLSTFADSGFDSIPVGDSSVDVDALLIAGAIVAALFSAALALLARATNRAPAESRSIPGPSDLTTTERAGRIAILAIAGGVALAAACLVVAPFAGVNDPAARPLVALGAAGAIVTAWVCLWVVADLRGRITTLPIGLAAMKLFALAAILVLLAGDPPEFQAFGIDVSGTTALWIGLGLAIAGALAIYVVYTTSWRARYGLRFLWPVSHRGLLALADVLLEPGRRQVSPEHVANGVEDFLFHFKAQRRWLYRFALMGLQLGTAFELAPVPRLNPPLHELDRDQRRRFLEDHFRRLPGQGGWRFFKHLRQITIRIGQQLVYAGYYGDRETYDSIGYQPFTKRPRFKELNLPEPGEHPLEVELPRDVDPSELVADVCIVGSGAAGSILAYELAKQGKEVLILERGDYTQPREFSENEAEMIGRLYSDGLMQQTEDWRFTVLQGSTVGGSTTVNNAVCFRPPESVLARWNDPADRDAGLDLARLQRSVEAVEAFLDVHRQGEAILNHGAGPFVTGAERLGLAGSELEVDVVRANVRNCPGSGYCNMGCRWGRKLSMLETALPWAQRDFPGKVRIVAECEVEKILTGDAFPVDVTGLVAKVGGHREVTVRARERYILASGAVASSYLMLRSGVGKGLPVGERFSANMGAPMTAELDEPQRSFDGLQISHYGRPRSGDAGYVFETWFNPPVAQALNMPGWFEQHFDNMSRYDHLMAVGVLVGTESNGKIVQAATGGSGIDFRPRDGDLRKLAAGLRQLGEILFAGGAKRVMLNTWGVDEYTSPDQLGDIDRVCADPDYIALGTGHPQGGNAISLDPSRGVVGPDFRVHGHSNLYICDASVFPTSLTVNPQLTVMSLAHYAAETMAERAPA